MGTGMKKSSIKTLLEILMTTGLQLLVWLLAGVNEALEIVIDILEWIISFRESRELWVEQVKESTNDKVAAYLKGISRNSTGNVLKKNVAVTEQNGRRVINFPLTKTWEDTDLCARKYELGTPSLCETKKNILLIGSESCNKRSFIDSLANHALGVTREDNFNVGVTTKNTEPQMIDVYTIPSTTNTRMHFTCNVLDLPDFTAKQSDQDVDSVLDRLSKLLKNPLVHGIDSIHAIVLLFHPEDQKLLSLYQHTHQYLIKLFGCEIEDKTFNLLSGKSAECNSYASLESMMTKAGIPQKVNYPFYCGTYYQDNSSLPKAELEQQGSEMEKSLDDFLGRLEAVKPQSLTLSHENLDKRTMATEGLQQLHSVIRVGLQQIQNVKTEKEQIKNEAKGCTYISEVKEFKYSIYRTNKIKRDLAYQGEAVTNCSVCFVTCHDHCEIEEDAGKADCCVMYDGYCTQCPGKCYWDQHFNRAFIVLVKVHKSEARFSEIPTRYNLNQSSKVSDLLNALNSDIRASEENVMENMKKTIHNTRVIHEISGKTSQTPAGNILEEIILGEKRDEVDGWKERIALLQLLKQRVEMELKMESIGNSKKQQ